MEDDHDLLTCGKCQREFALYDINKFIQHKVSRCNKENVQPTSCDDDVTKRRGDDTDDDSDDVTATSKRGGGGGVKLGHNHVDRPVTIKEFDDELTQKLCGKNLKEIFNNKESLERIIRDELCKGQGHLAVDTEGQTEAATPVKQEEDETKVDDSSLKSEARVDAETNTVYSGRKRHARTYDAMRSHRHVLCK